MHCLFESIILLTVLTGIAVRTDDSLDTLVDKVSRTMPNIRSTVNTRWRSSDNQKMYLQSRSMSREFMLKLYDDLTKGHTLHTATGNILNTQAMSQSDTVRTFPGKENVVKNVTQAFTFKISSISNRSVMKQAQVRIQNYGTIKRPGTFRIVIKKDSSILSSFVLRDRPVLLHDGKQSLYDVSRYIRPFVNRLNGNISVELHFQIFYKTRYSGKREKLNHWTPGKAILVMFSKDPTFTDKLSEHFRQTLSSKSSLPYNAREHSRQKRGTNKQRRVSNKTNRRRKRMTCHVEDYEVDFNHIGWGRWIIYPKIYNARVCKGVCTSPIHENLTPTNHAMLQSLMRVDNNKKRPPRPCCVPTKLKPLSMLYYETDEIVVRHHEDMIVDRCGCS